MSRYRQKDPFSARSFSQVRDEYARISGEHLSLTSVQEIAKRAMQKIRRELGRDGLRDQLPNFAERRCGPGEDREL